MGITPVRVYNGSRVSWGKAVQARYYDVVVNEEKVWEVLAVSEKLKEMAFGFLISNAFIEDPGSIEGISVEDDTINVAATPDFEFRMQYIRQRATTPLDVVEITPVSNGFVLPKDKILEKVSMAYRGPYDLPMVFISDVNGFLEVAEDVNSTNAFYKVLGTAMMKHFDVKNSFVVFSDILLPENVVRAAYLGIPIVGTLSMPVDLSINVAEALGLTVFSVSIDGVNVYTHPSRIQ